MQFCYMKHATHSHPNFKETQHTHYRFRGKATSMLRIFKKNCLCFCSRTKHLFKEETCSRVNLLIQIVHGSQNIIKQCSEPKCAIYSGILSNTIWFHLTLSHQLEQDNCDIYHHPDVLIIQTSSNCRLNSTVVPADTPVTCCLGNYSQPAANELNFTPIFKVS